ncbi:NUDIX domain-containing protein [Micromonospora sp. WMMD712]|uniref:NUDIX hydrolase n=1 Tax=Micromonospora sp. WMMD712 TaxID=3016096 RepID=UPI00249CC573|nr:NUDIX domain-containing protein [Micromonospora sp. WMMD712]WFE59398.1 NUDIX domain-containing protein [Micromonospora sp. WMMD712]
MARRSHEQLRLTADLAILTVREGSLQVLTVERGNEPFRGHRALPGGFVRPRETVDDTAARELREETGLAGVHLEQLAVFSDPDRDPSGRVVTIAYLAVAPDLPVPEAGSDAAAASWEPVDRMLDPAADLAFDHGQILAAAVERVRRKLEYTTLAAAFCGPAFTISELRTVYEALWGTRLDHRNFSRKVLGTDGFVIPTGQRTSAGVGRPAMLYERGPAVTLHPPMLRHWLDVPVPPAAPPATQAAGTAV